MSHCEIYYYIHTRKQSTIFNSKSHFKTIYICELYFVYTIKLSRFYCLMQNFELILPFLSTKVDNHVIWDIEYNTY